MIKASRCKFSKSALTILSVAESLFAQQGFKATSISEIAKQAGGSKANIYHHFKSKEHLYQEALKLACEDVFNTLELSTVKHSMTPKQRLKEYITRHLENMIEHPDSTNLIKRELMDNNQIEGQLLAKDIFANTFKKVTALVFETYNIQKTNKDITASIQAFMLIGVNMLLFDSQSVMKYIPEVSSFSAYSKVFSDIMFDFIMNQNTIAPLK
ncbi:MAG: helix-turn-helix transcriptional regulator [Colwellia sp.]|nr:helix-turn-helix transcriptional regulator [Colwellia sp.]